MIFLCMVLSLLLYHLRSSLIINCYLYSIKVYYNLLLLYLITLFQLNHLHYVPWLYEHLLILNLLNVMLQFLNYFFLIFHNNYKKVMVILNLLLIYLKFCHILFQKILLLKVNYIIFIVNKQH